MLTLSNCASWTEGQDPDGSKEIVRMPSISRGTIRNNQEATPKEEEAETTPDKKAASDIQNSPEVDSHETKPSTTVVAPTDPNEGRIPTQAQQDAAIQSLTKPTPAPETEPTLTPVLPADSPPVPPAEEELIPAPRPNSIELRGLRTPSLPNTLPMEVKG